jgi:hypothetical protein
MAVLSARRKSNEIEALPPRAKSSNMSVIQRTCNSVNTRQRTAQKRGEAYHGTRRHLPPDIVILGPLAVRETGLEVSEGDVVRLANTIGGVVGHARIVTRGGEDENSEGRAGEEEERSEEKKEDTAGLIRGARELKLERGRDTRRSSGAK